MVVTGLLWLTLSAAMIVAGMVGLAAAGDDSEASGQLGAAVDSGPSHSSAGTVPALVIVLTLAAVLTGLTVALVARKSWARFALVASGAAIVVTLAVTGSWLGFVAMALLIAATASSMSPAVQNYLNGEALRCGVIE
jgi:hypothetical protein